MAIAQQLVLYNGDLVVTWHYNEVNMRLTSCEWSVSANLTGRAFRGQIWRDLPGGGRELVYEKVVTGPESGSQNVPGRHDCTQVVDPIDGHPYIMMPEGYHFTIVKG